MAELLETSVAGVRLERHLSIAGEHRFTSPLDNGLDRLTYFSRCWLNNARIENMKFGEGRVGGT